MISAITAFFFFLGVFLFGILPFCLLYGFSNFFSFVLHRVVRYRLSIITQNLSYAFPEMNSKQQKRLVKLIYQNISDVFIEGVKAFSMTRGQITKRHKVINPELLKPYLDSNQSIIGVTAHYANWEWGSLSASTQIDAPIVAFYKKLNNKYIDRFVRSSRMKFGTKLVSIKKTAESFEDNQNRKTVYVMAADQNTLKRNLDKSHWVDFFGREIPFLHGPEKYAKLYNLPVVYIDIQRVKRGFYQIELSLLVENPRELEDGKITKRYARKLESIVRKKPQDWLWSHKRWKFAR